MAEDKVEIRTHYKEHARNLRSIFQIFLFCFFFYKHWYQFGKKISAWAWSNSTAHRVLPSIYIIWVLIIDTSSSLSTDKSDPRKHASSKSSAEVIVTPKHKNMPDWILAQVLLLTFLFSVPDIFKLSDLLACTKLSYMKHFLYFPWPIINMFPSWNSYSLLLNIICLSSCHVMGKQSKPYIFLWDYYWISWYKIYFYLNFGKQGKLSLKKKPLWDK